MVRKSRIRIAAIEVGHWHSLFDAAYLKTLANMPDVQLVGVQDPDADLVAQRAAQVGSPPVFTDYRDMMSKTRPDFVLALGRHSEMAGIAHFHRGHPEHLLRSVQPPPPPYFLVDRSQPSPPLRCCYCCYHPALVVGSHR